LLSYNIAVSIINSYPERNEMSIIYEDTQIIISEDKLEIKRYYFPVGTSKTIKFSEIKNIEEIDLTLFNGKGRLWGMSLAQYWYNWDNNRFWRKKAIVIHLGKTINPAITPDNYNEVIKILKNNLKYG
jgi:hypothetical protein